MIIRALYLSVVLIELFLAGSALAQQADRPGCPAQALIECRAVPRWMSSARSRRLDSEGRVFLSVVAIHEIEKGIAKAQDLVIVTHNKKHFLPFGVGVASPDEAVQSA